ncbi:Polypeptide N-acetylgalactosaminyltransferase 4 [Lamellibrachia satsuma]|nr:Polypeptide N-acetylgalactosaminyltransferase 4 [Lamellibrachia satsuma]
MILRWTNDERELLSQNDSIIRRKAQLLDRMRADRLRELQSTIFLHPDRPPDQTYNINVSQSERTPLERDVADSRPTACLSVRYDPGDDLTTTVIIPVYNEALSMLLRTVHSILRHTPDSLLEEIIIIDDHSPNHDLKEPLETYVKLLPKVKLLRTQEREGLIRVRLIGARLAKGKVLMFQDAHTESNVGWLEPLLDEIQKNPQTVIQPHIDEIDPKTIEYQRTGSHVPRGGFSWDLREVVSISDPPPASRIADVGCRSCFTVGSEVRNPTNSDPATTAEQAGEDAVPTAVKADDGCNRRTAPDRRVLSCNRATDVFPSTSRGCCLHQASSR